MITDPIADMLSQIKNAFLVKRATLTIPHSKLKEKIIEVLIEEGYLQNLKLKEEGKKKFLEIYLKYLEDGTPAVTDIKRVSKSSLRRYTSKKMFEIDSSLGISILTTSKGVLSDSKAKKLGVGGEIICRVY
ncbi:MAG: 30S ribosomal protein S8 [Candidatus Woykebacteria bacterium RBG_13_40_7b]|uniref:Small ribosomal subunit protein uS8 n=1 Tax=Candidatus Woykebacteria bacterium RBG_13_40_7b TaxID=1802594 RepID=A0A1G1W835_9BACT|nr:MAG: 30S ribosomal protein S8 [Candidatus Woykebacteria bacterium RBG_13_40_7b]